MYDPSDTTYLGNGVAMISAWTLYRVLVVSTVGLVSWGSLPVAAQSKTAEGPKARFETLQAQANRGDPKAQTELASMYANGLGTRQDYAEAVRWYRKAAEQGNDQAQFELGSKYGAGRGVPLDYSQAAYWYRKAAVQGNGRAQMALGGLYALGLDRKST